MARQKFVHFVPRPKPRKRPGRHTKNLNNTVVRIKYNETTMEILRCASKHIGS